MAGMMNPGLTVDDVYPVGSIYMSVNATDPGKLFGGTWQRIKERFLLGAGDTHAAGNTGGEFEHTLTLDEMPSHIHDFAIRVNKNNGTSSVNHTSIETSANWYEYVYTADGNRLVDCMASGGSNPHNITPPIWQFASGSAQHSQYKGVAA